MIKKIPVTLSLLLFCQLFIFSQEQDEPTQLMIGFTSIRLVESQMAGGGSSYTRHFDAFKFYGNTAIVIGSEVVVPTEDADRSDAGKTVNRRFTEVWMKRGTEWKKVIRHASNVMN